MTALGLGMLPAIARELPAWNYDEQARSLNLTLPAGVTPTLSVIAPNQMLIELPDTQIGDVAGQNIGDGLIEGIMLEQTTPDKVWMVVDFAPGTILETEQTAVPVESSAANDPLAADASLQQWQVRPSVVASRPDSSAIIAAASTPAPSTPALSVEAASLQANSAANLRGSGQGSGEAIAQAPNFPDLPVLKPAMPISAPVSVPPLEASPVPAQPAPIEFEQIESEQPAANLSSSDLPSEPPFIGELEEEINIPAVNEPAPTKTTAAADLPTVAPLPVLDSEVVSQPASEPTDEVESDVIADENSSEGSNLELANAASVPQAVPATVITVMDIPAENVNTPPTSRWPEPIPFGQPLP